MRWRTFARPKPGMDRIAITTVTFRPRFRQTRIKNHPPVTDLTLLEAPEYFADRFQVHNLEYWSQHFESQSAAYLNELKRKIGNAKSKLINVQVDARYNLADPDASHWEKSVKLATSWIDTAAL